MRCEFRPSACGAGWRAIGGGSLCCGLVLRGRFGFEPGVGQELVEFAGAGGLEVFEQVSHILPHVGAAALG